MGDQDMSEIEEDVVVSLHDYPRLVGDSYFRPNNKDYILGVAGWGLAVSAIIILAVFVAWCFHASAEFKCCRKKKMSSCCFGGSIHMGKMVLASLLFLSGISVLVQGVHYSHMQEGIDRLSKCFDAISSKLDEYHLTSLDMVNSVVVIQDDIDGIIENCTDERNKFEEISLNASLGRYQLHVEAMADMSEDPTLFYNDIEVAGELLSNYINIAYYGSIIMVWLMVIGGCHANQTMNRCHGRVITIFVGCLLILLALFAGGLMSWSIFAADFCAPGPAQSMEALLSELGANELTTNITLFYYSCEGENPLAEFVTSAVKVNNETRGALTTDLSSTECALERIDVVRTALLDAFAVLTGLERKVEDCTYLNAEFQELLNEVVCANLINTGYFIASSIFVSGTILTWTLLMWPCFKLNNEDI